MRRACECGTCHLCGRLAQRKLYGGPGPSPVVVPTIAPADGRTPRPTIHTLPPKPPHRPLQCIHFGRPIDDPGYRPCKSFHVCEIGEYGGKCRGSVECQKCERYETDG